MKICVRTFDLGTSEEKARKVCEEAMEFYASHEFAQMCDNKYPLMQEIGDLLTIVVNYCAAEGIDAQQCVDLAETKNILRGRYDTIEG